jgi:hypothetical protein
MYHRVNITKVIIFVANLKEVRFIFEYLNIPEVWFYSCQHFFWTFCRLISCKGFVLNLTNKLRIHYA